LREELAVNFGVVADVDGEPWMKEKIIDENGRGRTAGKLMKVPREARGMNGGNCFVEFHTYDRGHLAGTRNADKC
jgi:hypothetical protein